MNHTLCATHSPTSAAKSRYSKQSGYRSAEALRRPNPELFCNL
jgi:hypothetical protein